METKKKILATAVICLLVLLAVSIFAGFWKKQQDGIQLKVGLSARKTRVRRTPITSCRDNTH